MGRGAISLIGALTACTFQPTVDDSSLVDCVAHANCPRGALCLAQVCVPQPLTIDSLTAAPEVVEAGERCTFTASATHSLRTARLRYRWHQVLGSSVAITSNGSTAELTTVPGYVGNYAVEVIVENGRDPPARARVHCTALVSENAEFVVPGHSGNCSREQPCDSISSTSATRVYVGVDEAASGRTWVLSGSLAEFDNRELHGGFLYPGWRRDLDRSRTALSSEATYLTVSCNSCVVSGLTKERLFPASSTWRYLVWVTGTRVTLRDMRLLLRGGGDTATASGVLAADGFETIDLQGVRLTTDGFRARFLWGFEFGDGSPRVVDSEIDLRAAVADEKVGVAFHQAVEQPSFERVRVHLGDANVARGMLATCAAPRIVNTIVDARGEGGDYSEGLHIDSPQGCPTGGRIHSSLFVAGGGATSYGIRLLDPEPSVAIVNTIIDGGRGFARVGIDGVGLDGATDMAGTVVVLEGGEQTRDHWFRLADAGVPVAVFEAAVSCPGCLSTAETAAHLDPDSGDYHLTPESACCINNGAALGPSDPAVDYDGVTRDPGAPAAGPYELFIY